LIESYLNGIEVSVGVMNYKEEVKVFGITELITENDFLSKTKLIFLKSIRFQG